MGGGRANVFFDPVENDVAAGFEVTENFERFSQRDDAFCRAFWDPTVKSQHTDGFFHSYRMEAAPRRGEGFNQRDFALRNAAWAVSDDYSARAREGFLHWLPETQPKAEEVAQIYDKEEGGREIKRIAKFFGADDVGITAYDPRWTYSYRADPETMDEQIIDLPPSITAVIVLCHVMDYDLVRTYPSALAGASVGQGYSKEASTVVQLSQYIRNLGYEAVASMNDTALVIPYAIKAGLGEYGRNQMVITPKYGPRVRFSKIFTDMPLAYDQPRLHGVRQTCDICTRCADACPPKALPTGPPKEGGLGRSNIKGVVKWTADCEKCFGYWAKLKTDCAICMRVCPYNQPPNDFIGRLVLRLLRSPLRRLGLRLSDLYGRAWRLKPSVWWAAISK